MACHAGWTLLLFLGLVRHVSANIILPTQCVEYGYNIGSLSCSTCNTLSRILKSSHKIVQECRECCTSPLFSSAPNSFVKATLQYAPYRFQEPGFEGVREFVEHLAKGGDEDYDNLTQAANGSNDAEIILKPGRSTLNAVDKAVTLSVVGWKKEHIQNFLKRYLKGAANSAS